MLDCELRPGVGLGPFQIGIMVSLPLGRVS